MTDHDREARRRRRAELAFHALGNSKGNVKEAASFLGVAERTVRKQVADYCELMGFETPFEAAYRTEPVPEVGQIGTTGTART